NRPANKFVAGLIGAPPMNFIEGSIEEGVFKSGSIEFAIPAEHPAHGMDGKKVTFGIRPEDIYDASLTTSIKKMPGNSFHAKVDVLAKLGAEDTAYLKSGEHALTASLDPDSRIEMGIDAEFLIDLGKIHFFDGETEQAIR